MNPNLGACFALRCFQRLSVPNVSYPAMLLAEQLVHQRLVHPGPLVKLFLYFYKLRLYLHPPSFCVAKAKVEMRTKFSSPLYQWVPTYYTSFYAHIFPTRVGKVVTGSNLRFLIIHLWSFSFSSRNYYFESQLYISLNVIILNE